jgi:hypothetical protein
MIAMDDLSFVIGVDEDYFDFVPGIEVDTAEKVGRVRDDDVFHFAVAQVLVEAFGPVRMLSAMASFNPLADYIEVPIGCTKARVDLRPIRSAVAPLVRQAA